MAQFKLLMPKLGESIEEATITKWFVKKGDTVDDDDVLLEIATDKVDSEIPSPVSGTVSEILVEQDQTVAVGTVIAVIDTGGEEAVTGAKEEDEQIPETLEESPETASGQGEKTETGTDPGENAARADETEHGDAASGTFEARHEEAAPRTGVDDPGTAPAGADRKGGTGRFYSPLVLTIAREEGVSRDELDTIPGSGRNGRVQKKDILNFISGKSAPSSTQEAREQVAEPEIRQEKPRVSASLGAEDKIVEMDRMRKMIAEHMVMSKQTSAHVTNMFEADVTDIVLWRNRIKDEFQKREGEKITYLPAFLESIIQALKEYPMLNASVDGDRIIIKKAMNLGIAVALPSGNLIVPVIKSADALNLLGLTKALNKLADDARKNKLQPDDISGGTFTISNFGTFRNVMGTPIINQPQVAVLAIGTVEKKPAVIETPTGDVIGIRHKMFLSLTYDHRIIDGAYGGAFLWKLGDILQSFDPARAI